MERAKLDHHHHKQQHPLQGSSVAAPAAPPPVGSNLAWNTIVLLKGEDSSTSSGVGGDCRDSSVDPTQGYGPLVPPSPLSTSMVHELGIHWPCSADTSNQQEHLAKSTAEELPDYLLKLANFGSVWNPGDHPSPSTICNKYVQQGLHDKDLGLLCEDRFQFSARGRHHALPSQYASGFGGDAAAASEHLGSYSKLLLATNTPSSSSFPISFSMQELQALELLASARFGDILRQPSLCNVAFYGEGVACGLGAHRPLPHPGPSNELQKISSLLDEDTGGKRANAIPEHKASPPATKKPRTEPRPSSMSPLKVRKEKLGDRVAALQQLVAPFGKTDTASVLTEAVGYIKFLQEQVQTLSMPYMRSSNKSKIRTAQGVSNKDKDEIKQDLRSRGLCLVPLSYTTFFSSEGGSAWSPPCFRGIEM